MRIFRLIRILLTLLRHRLDGTRGRGERLRLAFESLGPVFVKFGQLLSVRPDLIPEDIANELAKLQDKVPPFSGEQAIAAIARSLREAPHARSSARSTPCPSRAPRSRRSTSRRCPTGARSR